MRRLLSEANHQAGPLYIANGKPNLLRALDGYNNAARISPWIVLIDLNGDDDCAPPFVTRHMPSPATQMVFRVCVRQVESWLLADRERIARFLRVSQARIPRNPDSEPDSKEALIGIARRSSDRLIREEMVPSPGSGRRVGPGYVARILEFIQNRWDPSVAAGHSESLDRCLRQLTSI